MSLVLIEIESNSTTFAGLREALNDSRTRTLRLAVDEGEFKVKVNEDAWTPELTDVTVKHQ